MSTLLTLHTKSNGCMRLKILSSNCEENVRTAAERRLGVTLEEGKFEIRDTSGRKFNLISELDRGSYTLILENERIHAVEEAGDPLMEAARNNVDAIIRLQAKFRAFKRKKQEVKAAEVQGTDTKKSPFVPSGMAVVAKFLKLAEVQTSDTVLDIGCGDGRVVNAAAKFCGSQGIGIDINESLLKKAQDDARSEGLEQRTQFCKLDFASSAVVPLLERSTVVFVFMLPTAMKLIEKLLLKHLRPGSKVVTYCFSLHSWPGGPQKTLVLDEVTKLFLYCQPSQPSKC
eukprot:g65172.t1